MSEPYTIKCPACNQLVSSEAEFCPHCGQRIKKKKGCLYYIAVAFAVLLVLGVIGRLMGNNDTHPPSSFSSKKVTQEAAPAPKEPEYLYKCKLSDIGTVRGAYASNVGVAIGKIATTNSIGNKYHTTQAQGVFILVFIAVTNGQNDVVTIDANSFKLIDDRGREFTHSVDGETSLTMLGEKSLFLTEVNPGNTVTGYIVYDVPADTNIVRMFFRGGMTGDEGEVPFRVMLVQ